MDLAHVPEAVSAYLDQIGRIPLLDARRERELAHRVRAGLDARRRLDTAGAGEREALCDLVEHGVRAREEMISANLRLVVAQARRLPRGPVPFLDLVQEGNVGLMAAVDRFDPELGFRFSTYAHDWIAQAMWAALASDRLIRLPAKAGARATHCRRVREELAVLTRREPGVDELAAATGFDPAQVELLLRAEQVTVPLDLVAHAAASHDDPGEPVERRDAAERVLHALGCLDPEERTVLELRFGIGSEPCTLAETARRTGSDVPGVRRLERRALDRLRRRPAMVQLQEAAGA
ncbi:sigma-70 family RNA polymerase sigma factor [Solicola sp. PLA-1-18]|uniref:sigma-70 family RNA polymerase sigma factor n=1 Tax=Solicola sp. PLA-1-18 TaxID=3380532 RepID=UPI003B7C043C